MGKIGSGKAQISVGTDEAIVRLIAERAQAISFSNSAYVADVLKWWIERGAPPVNQLDKIMQVHHNRDALLAAAEDRPKKK